jgi:hypothetical protein
MAVREVAPLSHAQQNQYLDPKQNEEEQKLEIPKRGRKPTSDTKYVM